MNIVSIRGASFDDAATLAMGEAFDRACVSLRRFRTSVPVREIIARHIVSSMGAVDRRSTKMRPGFRPERIFV
jgi:hypothetical protein